MRSFDKTRMERFCEPTTYKMTPRTEFEGTFLGTAKSPYWDRDKEKQIWYHHHIFLVNGKFLMLKGDHTLNRCLEDLSIVAQALGGIKVYVAYAGSVKKTSKKGATYNHHRWTVRTETAWTLSPAEDMPPGEVYTDDIDI